MFMRERRVKGKRASNCVVEAPYFNRKRNQKRFWGHPEPELNYDHVPPVFDPLELQKCPSSVQADTSPLLTLALI
jgi:hypothetical protein